MAINGGLISVAPGITSDQAINLSTQLQTNLQQSISSTTITAASTAATTIAQTATAAVAQNVTNTVASVAAGAGLTAVGSALATSLSGSITGSVTGSLGSVFSSLSAGLPILGSAFALSSALNNISALPSSITSGTNLNFSQIPPVAKGLEANGPTVPQGVSIGPAGFLNAAVDPSISSIFSQLAQQLTQFSRIA